MSRDWTPEELQAVSKSMKAAGHMSFEEFVAESSKQTLDSFIAKFSEVQRAGHFPCPRCGQFRMSSDPIRNSLSRYASIQVCDACGTDEAIRDFTGDVLPSYEWSIYKNPDYYIKVVQNNK